MATATAAPRGVSRRCWATSSTSNFHPTSSPPSTTPSRRPIAGQEHPLTLEVEQLLGNNVVRCVGMGPTDGMKRGQDAFDTGAPITVPVGPETLGRIFNVLGQPIDNMPAPATRRACRFTVRRRASTSRPPRPRCW